MATEYTIVPEFELPRADVSHMHDTQPPVPDVEKGFARLRPQGEFLRAWDGDQIPGWRYTGSKHNQHGLNNHFQGVMRLRNGPYAAISGGDPHETMSHLFIVKLATRADAGAGPWRTNAYYGDPIMADTIVRTIGLDVNLWHGGGMDTLGDILAIPIESSDLQFSRIVFLDMADPGQPRRVDPGLDIQRDGTKAGGVALTKLGDGRYLCGVWSDSDRLPVRLDCYVSKTADFADGFHPKHRTWLASTCRAAGGQDRDVPKFQAINFIRQADGALYLAGLHNTSPAAPVLGGTDEVHLFLVDIAGAPAPPGIATPVLTKVATHRLTCTSSQCNLDACGGVYVAPDGLLLAYGAFHFRMEQGPMRQLRLTEFRPHTDGPSNVTSPGNAWFELFEKPYFEGRYLAMRGLRDTAITDYERLLVQSRRTGFDNKVTSARYQIPQGMRYALFKHNTYRTRIAELTGTGRVEEIPDLAAVPVGGGTVDAARQTSSSRYEYLNAATGKWVVNPP